VVEIRVSCPPGVGRCAGVVGLRTLVSYGGSIRTLASSPFTAPGGETRLVKLRLTAKARALLRRVRVLRVHATLVARDSSGASYAERSILSLRLKG